MGDFNCIGWEIWQIDNELKTKTSTVLQGMMKELGSVDVWHSKSHQEEK